MKWFVVILLFVNFAYAADSWQSSLVYYNSNDSLVYAKDDIGNRIPDFSYVGYRNGDEPIPGVPVVKTIQPIPGDNTIHIESALFEVALRPKDENGFRGALLLEAGIYEINGTINFQYDGIVLRGMGDGEDSTSNTILWATGNSPAKRTVVVAGGGYDSGWSDGVSGTYKTITSDTVFLDDLSFEVSGTTGLTVGDNIIIEHDATDEWLAAIDYGGTHSGEGAYEPGIDVPWTVGSLPVRFNRHITKIEGNRIFIDAPIYNQLVYGLSQSRIYKYSRKNLMTRIGVENLRIDIETNGMFDENHAWNALDLVLVEDAWVRDCTFLNFGLSGVRTNSATRVTVENCRAIDPVAKIEGGKLYNFNTHTSSQLILFKDCYARNGRHHYVSNGKSTVSGIVFLDCKSEGAYTSSEGHRRWSQGLLFDNHVELDGPRAGLNKRLLGLYNRGYYGTSHGWAAVNSVAWNCDVNDGYLIVQKPPTAQNYAIGCSGLQISGVKPYAPFDDPEGYIEGSNQGGLRPRSLYEAQLEERRKNATSIDQPDPGPKLPGTFTLMQNYPNPFNPSTVITFAIPAAGDVKLSVYDISGKWIINLLSGFHSAGKKQVRWDGLNYSGQIVASGIYFYSLDYNGSSESKRMLLIR